MEVRNAITGSRIVTDPELDQFGGPDAPVIAVLAGSTLKSTATLCAQVVDDKGQACHYWFVYRSEDSRFWKLTPATYPGRIGDILLEQIVDLQPGTYQLWAVISNQGGRGVSANVATFAVQP